MVSKGAQSFIKRNRPPRVQIAYQDPYDSERMVELPFVMGVMADLAGNAPGADKPTMDKRKFLDIDMDNFDARMAAIQPGVRTRVPDRLSGEEGATLSVELTFEKMDDFSPAAVARKVPALARLLEAREQLANLLVFMDGRAAAEERLRELLSNPELMRALAARRTDEAAEDRPAEDAEEA